MQGKAQVYKHTCNKDDKIGEERMSWKMKTEGSTGLCISPSE